MKPDNVMKAIAAAVKSKEELRGVVCVYKNKRTQAQNPVSSFTLCIEPGKSKYTKYTESEPSLYTEIKLCLLAPLGAGGKRLSERGFWIFEAIKESVSVSSVEVCEPRYNDTNSTLYSDITVTIEDISTEESNYGIYIDGNLAEGLVSFEVESAELTEKKGELLNGYTFEKTGYKDFLIKLKTRSPMEFSEVFTIKVSENEIYEKCRVHKALRELSKWGNLNFTYIIRAEEVRYE